MAQGNGTAGSLEGINLCSTGVLKYPHRPVNKEFMNKELAELKENTEM